jgi:hypothetical protein
VVVNQSIQKYKTWYWNVLDSVAFRTGWKSFFFFSKGEMKCKTECADLACTRVVTQSSAEAGISGAGQQP